jgi:lysozyme
MKASDAALALIKAEEGCRLTGYLDSKGIPTIGWGHTGAEVYEGQVWTQAQADAALAADVAGRAEAPINASVKVPLSQGQFDALCSLVYNIGGGHFATSTLLRVLNTGDYRGAHTHFAEWKRASTPDELLPRRAREMWLFARSS